MKSSDLKQKITDIDERIKTISMQIAGVEGCTQREGYVILGGVKVKITHNTPQSGYRDVPLWQYRELARYLRNGLADERRWLLAKKRDLQLQLAKALRAEADSLCKEADMICAGRE